MEIWGDDTSAFSAVLSEELELIKRRRDGLVPGQSAWIEESSIELPVREGDEDGRIKRLRLVALRNHLTGLAISGGGIRSGTFAVGILQGLAAHGLIRRFDYLSTVSGGGYAGA